MKKDVKFQWNQQCQKSLDILKEKMVSNHILIFPNLRKEFYVHVDVSLFALDIVLAELGEGSLDHTTAFDRRKLSTT